MIRSAWNPPAARTLRSVLVALSLPLLFVFSPPAHGQESPLPLFRELGLQPVEVGSTTLYATPGHEAWAGEIVRLVQDAGAVFEDSLGLSFDATVAVLGPAQWRSWFVTGDGVVWADEQYGMPWAWPPDRLLAVPATLDEGMTITDPSDIQGNRSTEELFTRMDRIDPGFRAWAETLGSTGDSGGGGATGAAPAERRAGSPR